MPTLLLHFFLFLITTSLTNLIPTVYSNCIEAQKRSLLHFKESLLFDSSSSSKLITWNLSTDCCSWLGVTCSTKGNVVGLDLSRESISCSIDSSSSLFQLHDLQSLDLAYNDFNLSSIPSAIGNLKMLSTISLSNCSFTGSLPKSIENLTKLVELHIALNMISNPISSIHWENLVNLESLHLSNNQLSGTIPSSLVSLPKLVSLTLSHNQFSGHVPEFSNTSSNLLDTKRMLSLSVGALGFPHGGGGDGIQAGGPPSFSISSEKDGYDVARCCLLVMGADGLFLVCSSPDCLLADSLVSLDTIVGGGSSGWMLMLPALISDHAKDLFPLLRRVDLLLPSGILGGNLAADDADRIGDGSGGGGFAFIEVFDGHGGWRRWDLAVVRRRSWSVLVVGYGPRGPMDLVCFWSGTSGVLVLGPKQLLVGLVVKEEPGGTSSA